jgi:TRAP-type C4-dicarboxylate transport system permease small subunit
MYLSQILQYLILPAFILLSWFAVQYAITVYEKKSSEEEEKV